MLGKVTISGLKELLVHCRIPNGHLECSGIFIFLADRHPCRVLRPLNWRATHPQLSQKLPPCRRCVPPTPLI